MSRSAAGRLSYGMFALFAADRLLKMLALSDFFGRKPPAGPARWPSVTLVQPLTRGANLRATLPPRAHLDYPGHIRHLFLCDAHDKETRETCRGLLARYPGMDGKIVLVDERGAVAASKSRKLVAAMTHIEGEVVCSVDDDIILRPCALRVLVPYLYLPGAGAAFGLACYTNWNNLPSSLMSAFVNSNALLTYVPGTYLTEPFTITGHIFALRLDTFRAIGGFGGLENQVGDDHETARRVRAPGLRCVQTPLIYDVDNYFPSVGAYAAQMKRWFVFPRQALLPYMTGKEQFATFVTSVGSTIPGLLALLALFTRRGSAVRAFGCTMALSGAVYAACERLYLKRCTPLTRWPVVLLAMLASPLQIVGALLSGDTVEWRGKRVRVYKGGAFEDEPC